tara:strand:- start:530 stop:655 length:126 start_codon:yes stop_codon:yes gene_type:complete
MFPLWTTITGLNFAEFSAVSINNKIIQNLKSSDSELSVVGY